MEATKNEGVVDHGTMTRWLKKFLSSYKNVDNQAKSSWLNNINCEALL